MNPVLPCKTFLYFELLPPLFLITKNQSCFVTSTDSNAWSLTFFFIPAGICLLLGLICFGAALTEVVITAFRVRKLKVVLIPYIRLLLFVFEFFLVFALFCAYVINNAANNGTITSGYEAYYQCLSGATPTPVSECQLSTDVSNFPLVMLKGFALSCLGVLLFFTFMSWSLIRHWWRLFWALGRALWTRQKGDFGTLWNLVAHVEQTTLAPATVECSAISLGPQMHLASEDEGSDDASSSGNLSME